MDSGFESAELWVLENARLAIHSIRIKDTNHGVVVYGSEEAALRDALLLPGRGLVPRRVSFEEARDIAKTKPLHITGLILRDTDEIHHVR